MRRVAQIVEALLQRVVLALQLAHLLGEPVLLRALLEERARRRHREDGQHEDHERQDRGARRQASALRSASPLGLRRGKSPWPARSWRPATTRWSARQEGAAPRSGPSRRAPPRSAGAGCTSPCARRGSGAPVLICPAFVATARSAIVVSSVSPLRWLITTPNPERCASAIASTVSVSVPIWFTLIRIAFAAPLADPALEALGVRHEQVVADELRAVAQRRDERRPIHPNRPRRSPSSIDTIGNRSSRAVQYAIMSSALRVAPSSR